MHGKAVAVPVGIIDTCIVHKASMLVKDEAKVLAAIPRETSKSNPRAKQQAPPRYDTAQEAS